MKTRIISGIIYGLLIIFATHPIGSELLQKIHISISQKTLFASIMLILFLVTTWETCRMMKYDNWLFIFITILLGGIVIYFFLSKFLTGTLFLQFELKYCLIILLTLIAIVTVFKYSDEIVQLDTSKLIFNVVYLGIPFALVFTLPKTIFGFGKEVFYIFVLIWVSDTVAYFVGTKWGKTKIFPTISPNKSREGLIAGILATVICGIIIELNNSGELLQGNYIIVGAIVALLAPLGDLMASKLKRTFDVKDSGKLLPGHGGLLDRLDSFILCVPFVFLYFIIDIIHF